jgi:hypothetical protein
MSSWWADLTANSRHQPTEMRIRYRSRRAYALPVWWVCWSDLWTTDRQLWDPNTRPEMRQFDIINMSPYYPLLDFGGDYPRITILFGIANSFAFFSWIVGHKLYGCASSDKLRYQIAQWVKIRYNWAGKEGEDTETCVCSWVSEIGGCRVEKYT